MLKFNFPLLFYHPSFSFPIHFRETNKPRIYVEATRDSSGFKCYYTTR